MKRRDFIKSAAAFAIPAIVPASVLGRNSTAPSDRIVMGCIGLGGQGTYNMRAFINQPDVQLAALCDVDEGVGNFDMLYQFPGNDAGLGPALDKAVQWSAESSHPIRKNEITLYKDFRELLARNDIDAVTVCTPDHWHGLISHAALMAGKDVYCEKPLVNSIPEGRAVCDAVELTGRVLQCGSHERSNDSVRYAYELVQNGRIGELTEIHIQMPNSDSHHDRLRTMTDPQPPMPVPDGFDYDFWLGPAAWAPYTRLRTHFWWRFILETGGGEMTDRGAHIIDLGQFINNADDSGPVRIEATGERVGHGLFDCFIEYDFNCDYANGVKMLGTSKGERGLKLVGADGWIFIHIHGGRLEASDPAILESFIGPDEVHVPRSPGHHRNFLDSVKSRKQPVATAEIGHRTATICHLLNVAMQTNRPIEWNPKTERITNDAAMDKMIRKPMRQPWRFNA